MLSISLIEKNAMMVNIIVLTNKEIRDVPKVLDFVASSL
ncbi:hypothetical protein JCM19298_2796 [Nonlabens ulvanivorans]|nr:hypothetical protein JCM19298_2796 [Nonlabens ulvanivorans]